MEYLILAASFCLLIICIFLFFKEHKKYKLTKNFISEKDQVERLINLASDLQRLANVEKILTHKLSEYEKKINSDLYESAENLLRFLLERKKKQLEKRVQS